MIRITFYAVWIIIMLVPISGQAFSAEALVWQAPMERLKANITPGDNADAILKFSHQL